MPRKKTQQPRPVIDHYPDPDEASILPALDDDPEAEPAPEPPRPSRKKNRNAHNTPPPVEDSSPEPTSDDPVAQLDPPPRPIPDQSLLSHIRYPVHSKSKPVDIREELIASEKVSDQYTPPSDGGLAEDLYSRSPHSVAVSSAANTPPVEPAFSTRHSFKARSPPTSPPSRNVRPVSFGANIPPLPGYTRYPPGNYGSPPVVPAPPHMPQPHFYAAHDLDIAIASSPRAANNEEPAFTKFVQLPFYAAGTKHGIITGYDGRLNVCSFDGAAVEEVGALSNLPGVVVDADLLRWTSGKDPYAELRPLVVVTLMHSETSAGGTHQYDLNVSVYSLSQQKFILDLLHTPIEPVQHMVQGPPSMSPLPCNHLRLRSAGNYLSVSSGRSGEVYVFSPCANNGNSRFECLGKFWTTIQPKEQRRDSSHHRVATPEIAAANSQRFRQDENVPIMSMSARWLAICPPGAVPNRSIGAAIGEGVVAHRQAGVEATTAGARPSINCEVDSPDADTLLGKVARGVAQEVVKAGRWLGDQGMQYWQNYWKKDDQAGPMGQPTAYSNMGYANAAPYGPFPPTHADATPAAKDPELVSIFDLKAIHEPSARKTGALTALSTFQPPHGCSFLSFAPHGLSLLTASNIGDYQYVWNLLEMKHVRTHAADTDSDTSRSTPRVRQLARFDRLSGSVIVDVVWQRPTLSRLAILTKNKTIHLFDLPASAIRWPPAKAVKKSRPTSAPPTGAYVAEHEAAPPGGFFASAMNIAGRTQPMLANLRGRTPSTSGGFAGIGQAGFGIATATGARGSKAVAAGFSKSLGAATETVSRLQHAGDNKVHLKSERDVIAGRLIWLRRASKHGVCVLSENGLKYYQVRKSKARDQRQRDATVFEARRAVVVKFPALTTMMAGEGEEHEYHGFWKAGLASTNSAGSIHPLSFAEIETNAPFQPFHSDHRVTLSVFGSDMQGTQVKSKKSKPTTTSQEQWVFGDELASVKLNISPMQSYDDDELASVIYRETSMTTDNLGQSEQIVSTTRKRKPKRGASAHASSMVNEDGPQQEGFFEDDCDVLDFATDRV
ncbi:hypothetical protein LTR70_005835 [Exophiala xenobiotica]|uniref:Uncharacterized protein n=1 Tax=Lithohypha guttulata TaxID=1690604 RepID=A0ABR0K8V3_9EURO|nr:hypothetical protein LTR24_005431 [Lithohypha guttulata]KAK5317335.1 hypothetical protein LTR70_005835 [Exophiala xenobiotica]